MNVSYENVRELLKNVDGILVAPGFGERGIEGKIIAIRYVREQQIPFFGICLGMQCAVVEFARNVLDLDDAASTEIDQLTPYPVINMMEEQKNITQMGGTMRLGAYECELEANSNAQQAYECTTVHERHRHRYEFNDHYEKQFNTQDGLNRNR